MVSITTTDWKFNKSLTTNETKASWTNYPVGYNVYYPSVIWTSVITTYVVTIPNANKVSVIKLAPTNADTQIDYTMPDTTVIQ